LRGIANRVASILSPLAMGAIAEAVGLEYSFYVVGALVSFVMIATAIDLWGNPTIAQAGEDQGVDERSFPRVVGLARSNARWNQCRPAC
jgi:hypothetical protein